MNAKWPGRIAPGGTSDLPICFYDMIPTFADGISILPTLLGKPGDQIRHLSHY